MTSSSPEPAGPADRGGAHPATPRGTGGSGLPGAHPEHQQQSGWTPYPGGGPVGSGRSPAGYGPEVHASPGHGQDLWVGQPNGHGPSGHAYPPPGQPSPYGQPSPGGLPVSTDEQTWAVLAHASVPFLGVVGPLVVYLLHRDGNPYLRATAAEALNFSLLYTLAQVVGWVLTAVLIGFVLLPVVFVGGLVLAVLGALAASRHELYRYPVSLRLVA